MTFLRCEILRWMTSCLFCVSPACPLCPVGLCFPYFFYILALFFTLLLLLFESDVQLVLLPMGLCWLLVISLKRPVVNAQLIGILMLVLVPFLLYL